MDVWQGERIPFTDNGIPLRHMVAGMDVANVLLTIDKYSLQVRLNYIAYFLYAGML